MLTRKQQNLSFSVLRTFFLWSRYFDRIRLENITPDLQVWLMEYLSCFLSTEDTTEAEEDMEDRDPDLASSGVSVL